MTRVAVVGHVEWVEFVRVDRYPERGGLVQGERVFEHAGGGAVVAAAAIAELPGAEVSFFGAFGDDERGRAAVRDLEQRGITVHAAWRDAATRFVFTVLDAGGERTIVTVGERHAPAGGDDLPWEKLGSIDGVYVTAGDSGAIAHARRARAMVVTPRADRPARGVTADAVVLSASDEDERRWARPWEAHTRLMVATEGAHGGRWWGESEGRWPAAPLPGEPRDSYGCGDSFAGGFTYGLAEGRDPGGAAGVGAACGARMLTRVGAP